MGYVRSNSVLLSFKDFFQIPPVIKAANPRTQSRLDLLQEDVREDLYENKGFTFESNAWHICFPRGLYQYQYELSDSVVESHFELTEVFRQRDFDFVQILNEARLGFISDSAIEKLRQCRAPLSTADGIEPTLLYSRNRGVKYAYQPHVARGSNLT